jgi:hypothetical protein
MTTLEGPADPHAYIIKIPEGSVGLVIGKGGEHIKSLQEEGVSVKVGREGVDGERYVFVSGSEKGYRRVRAKVEEIVERWRGRRKKEGEYYEVVRGRVEVGEGFERKWGVSLVAKEEITEVYGKKKSVRKAVEEIYKMMRDGGERYYTPKYQQPTEDYQYSETYQQYSGVNYPYTDYNYQYSAASNYLPQNVYNIQSHVPPNYYSHNPYDYQPSTLTLQQILPGSLNPPVHSLHQPAVAIPQPVANISPQQVFTQQYHNPAQTHSEVCSQKHAETKSIEPFEDEKLSEKSITSPPKSQINSSPVDLIHSSSLYASYCPEADEDESWHRKEAAKNNKNNDQTNDSTDAKLSENASEISHLSKQTTEKDGSEITKDNTQQNNQQIVSQSEDANSLESKIKEQPLKEVNTTESTKDHVSKHNSDESNDKNDHKLIEDLNTQNVVKEKSRESDETKDSQEAIAAKREEMKAKL